MSYPSQEFLKELETLSQHDRQEIETFIGYLKSRPQKTSPFATNLLQKVNDKLLEGYVKLTINNIDFDDDYENLLIVFSNRDRPISFPYNWFNDLQNDLVYTNNVKDLFVKYRSNSNRIDKIAIDSKYLSEKGKTEGKKRILAINSTSLYITPTAVTITAPLINNTQNISADNLQKVVDNLSVPKSTSSFIIASVSKINPIFDGITKFAEGRLRSARVAEIMVAFISKIGKDNYTWDSESFYGCKHDFTNVKPGLFYGKTIDIKAHFHPNDRLQLSEFTLNNVDADIILAVLVEENQTEYKATICGWIYKSDFMARTTPWAYNETVKLRSLEIHELNSPQDLF